MLSWPVVFLESLPVRVGLKEIVKRWEVKSGFSEIILSISISPGLMMVDERASNEYFSNGRGLMTCSKGELIWVVLLILPLPIHQPVNKAAAVMKIIEIIVMKRVMFILYLG